MENLNFKLGIVTEYDNSYTIQTVMCGHVYKSNKITNT